MYYQKHVFFSYHVTVVFIDLYILYVPISSPLLHFFTVIRTMNIMLNFAENLRTN